MLNCSSLEIEMSCIWYFIFFILVIPERGGEKKPTSFEVLGSLWEGLFSEGCFFFFLIDAPKAVT